METAQQAAAGDEATLAVSVAATQYKTGRISINVGVKGSADNDPLALIDLIRRAKASLDEIVEDRHESYEQ